MASSESKGLRRPRISLVFPYYDNPEMLRFQLGIISGYSGEIQAACEILIVDDCSPQHPARGVVEEFTIPSLRLFRLEVDKPWNQDAARNIGAYEASGDYLLVTDIDHVVPESTLSELMAIEDKTIVHTLARKAHFSDKVIPSHVNSYFMAKSLYWSIGGYDEEFWGTYGSDRLFRDRVTTVAPVVELARARLELVTGGSISDAKNISLSRQPSPWRKFRSLLLRAMKSMGLRRSPVTLVNSYHQEI
jgi:hypothetical protein